MTSHITSDTERSHWTIEAPVLPCWYCEGKDGDGQPYDPKVHHGWLCEACDERREAVDYIRDLEEVAKAAVEVTKAASVLVDDDCAAVNAGLPVSGRPRDCTKPASDRPLQAPQNRRTEPMTERRCDYRDCRKPATHAMGRYPLCAPHAKPALHPRDLAPLIAKMPKAVSR